MRTFKVKVSARETKINAFSKLFYMLNSLSEEKLMKNSKLKNLFVILFLGGLWGFLEATLGALLHLGVFDSIMFTSTAVMLPLAYLIMGHAYKETGKATSAFYVGLIAASIKAVCFFYVPMVNKVVNPMVAIVLESLVTASAFAVAKPSKILSIRSFVSFICVSTVARIGYVGYSIATAVPFMSAYINGGSLVWSEIVKYVVTANAISFAYLAAYMGCGLLVNNLSGEKAKTIVRKIVYSPACAAAMVAVAFAVTIIL